jgi:hypothetical protein
MGKPQRNSSGEFLTQKNVQLESDWLKRRVLGCATSPLCAPRGRQDERPTVGGGTGRHLQLQALDLLSSIAGTMKLLL